MATSTVRSPGNGSRSTGAGRSRYQNETSPLRTCVGYRGMASVSSSFNRAVALHREAAAHTEAAKAELARRGAPVPMPAHAASTYQRLAEQLNRSAAAITRGWLGCELDAAARSRKLGIDA